MNGRFQVPGSGRPHDLAGRMPALPVLGVYTFLGGMAQL